MSQLWFKVIPRKGKNKMYKIIRHYQEHSNEVIAVDLTLEEAQAHCKDPETSSSTCKEAVNTDRTDKMGEWFDGYTESGN